MRKIKRIASMLVLLTFVFAAALFLPTDTVLAKEKPSLNSSSGTVFMYTEDTVKVTSFGEMQGGLESITWSSSNKSVLTVKAHSKTGVECRLIPKKPGKATVKCTINTTEDTYDLECEITVKRANAFRKIYVSSSNVYKSKTSAVDFITKSSKTTSVKVNAKLRSGWSLAEIFYEKYNSKNNISSTGYAKRNDKVPVGKYCTKIYFTARNSSNEFLTYTVTVKKPFDKSSKPKFSAKSGFIFQRTQDNELTIKNFAAGSKVTWSSSNNRVCKVASKKGDNSTAILTPKRKGKAAITCVVKSPSGAKTTLKYNVTVKGKVSPLSAVKIDGTNIIKKAKYNYYSMKTKDHSMQVQSYANSNWRFVSEKYVVYKTPKIYTTEQKVVGEGHVPVGDYKTSVILKLKSKKGYTYTFTVDLFNSNYRK